MNVAGNVSDVWMEFVATRCLELRNELITTYLPLVRFVVSKLKISPSSLLEFDDLVSYGILGLMKAIDRFDPSRGVRFEAFAIARIRGAVIDQLRVLNWLPRSAVRRIQRAETAQARLEQDLGRLATEEEVAADLQMPIGRYRQILLEASITICSLDAPLFQDNETTQLANLLEDGSRRSSDEEIVREELLASLDAAIDQLPARESLLLFLYYQKELTMKEISKVLGLSQTRISQLRVQALSRLRSVMMSHAEFLTYT